MSLARLNFINSWVGLFLVLNLTSCMWESKGLYYSPNGENSFRVLTHYPLSFETVRIRIESRKRTILDKTYPQECHLNFLDVVWSADSKRVAFFAKGMVRIEFAYDIQKNREIAFSEMRQTVARHIEKEYSTMPGTDPLECGLCVEEFRKRFPNLIIH